MKEEMMMIVVVVDVVELQVPLLRQVCVRSRLLMRFWVLFQGCCYRHLVEQPVVVVLLLWMSLLILFRLVFVLEEVLC